ncbi:2,3-bisphosphoglycerate-independent phosphoglycerate mutase [Helicobacter brantae]|uniref:2,3-bisphosphoglycerate-independent phosphoglycerate mutase n=1 Tax=Helicobacter brantae TaxID=375927 RepID=A0A3D8IYX1_9HELI|nr:2,3-bisphosphoglycerate-independent phosphoglycerate mutase [Helicobacter brantae]RDU70243.1 phosphoglycerate mutase (2,3-diphosphoglycerate-independent) [Helicobacter brantae]
MPKAILIITDGIGHSTCTQYNAFFHAKTPTYDWLFSHAPHSLLHTYGESVGLPKGQMGNSEVGHMTLGSGRIIYQDLLKISHSLQEPHFISHPHIQTLLNCHQIHLVGLLSDGGVHSHISHLLSILSLLRPYNRPIWLHLISDGRDVSPQSLQNFLDTLSSYLDSQIKIATLSGRYYAMDRDKRWERVKLAYDVMTSASPTTSLPISSYIQKSYEEGGSDEFICPVAFEGFEGINDGDGVLFWNFRSDRMRELSVSFADPHFNAFDTKTYLNLYALSFTLYDENLPLPILFPKTLPKNTLSEILSLHNLSQAHIAETEKYAHITFFFNGGVEKPYPKEQRILIPSPQVATYDLCPQMSAEEVGRATLECMENGIDFIVVNFANGDMVGHTGDFEAGIKAVESVDKELGAIVSLAQKKGYSLILTSDHGNCEKMKDAQGNTLTNHTIGDVWCFVLDERVKTLANGSLTNVAPSILKLLNLPIPQEMDKPLF